MSNCKKKLCKFVGKWTVAFLWSTNENKTSSGWGKISNLVVLMDNSLPNALMVIFNLMKYLLCNKKDTSTIPYPDSDKPNFITKKFCGFFKWSHGQGKVAWT